MIRAIDAVSTAAGWLAGWFIVPITVAVTYEVVARYAFRAPTTWSYEVGYMLYGAQFMLAAAYTLLKGGHIRTDVLYERWSARTRAAVDAVCYVLFFFPGMLCILYAGAVEARQAWEIGERTGLRIVGVSVPMYALKAIIPLTAALLVLQGLAELIRCGRAMRSPGR
ncbi:MAG TPA: TRAP transporter small permease subunit [Methylomirabilota bacterium]|jgi:TRAP-type mannitol/chloroaromatic compound transport system permease small subunit